MRRCAHLFGAAALLATGSCTVEAVDPGDEARAAILAQDPILDAPLAGVDLADVSIEVGDEEDWLGFSSQNRASRSGLIEGDPTEIMRQALAEAEEVGWRVVFADCEPAGSIEFQALREADGFEAHLTVSASVGPPPRLEMVARAPLVDDRPPPSEQPTIRDHCLL